MTNGLMTKFLHPVTVRRNLRGSSLCLLVLLMWTWVPKGLNYSVEEGAFLEHPGDKCPSLGGGGGVSHGAAGKTVFPSDFTNALTIP